MQAKVRNEDVIEEALVQKLTNNAGCNMLWYWRSFIQVKGWLKSTGYTFTRKTPRYPQKKRVPATEEPSTEDPPAPTAIPEPVNPESIPPEQAPYALTIMITFVSASAFSVFIIYRMFANTAGTEEEEAEARRQLAYHEDRFARQTILTR